MRHDEHDDMIRGALRAAHEGDPAPPSLEELLARPAPDDAPPTPRVTPARALIALAAAALVGVALASVAGLGTEPAPSEDPSPVELAAAPDPTRAPPPVDDPAADDEALADEDLFDGPTDFLLDDALDSL